MLKVFLGDAEPVKGPAPADSSELFSSSSQLENQPSNRQGLSGKVTGSQKAAKPRRESYPDPYGLWRGSADAPEQEFGAYDADYKSYGELHGQIFDPYD